MWNNNNNNINQAINSTPNAMAEVVFRNDF